MAIGRFPSIVIDCPDPDALAAFYDALLNWKVEASLQQVESYVPPKLPLYEGQARMWQALAVGPLAQPQSAGTHQPGRSGSARDGGCC